MICLGTLATGLDRQLWPWFVAALLVAAALALAWRLLPTERARRRKLLLHQELAAANQLTDTEAAWLWEISSSAKIDQPALVFVQPRVFDDQVATVGTQPALAKVVRGKLFGTDTR